MNTDTKQPSKSNYSKALQTATRLLYAKQLLQKRQKELCQCRAVIGDSPSCPLHQVNDDYKKVMEQL